MNPVQGFTPLAIFWRPFGAQEDRAGYAIAELTAQIHESFALAVDQYEVKIHDVGQGWAGHDQITQLSEKMIGIIAVQIVLNR